MRSIAVLNQKGGVGKTTSTVNVGAGLSERGKRVLLIDMDPQAHLTLHLGVEPAELEHSVYDCLTSNLPLDKVMIRRSDTLHIVPSHINLAGAEIELVNTIGREQLLRDAVNEVADRYDYLLIDCPPSLGLLSLNALVACNEVFVPLQTQFLAMQGMSQLLETTQLVSRRLNPKLRVSGIIFCQFDRRTSLSREVVEEVRGHFGPGDAKRKGPTVFETHIRQTVRLAEAPSFGKTIFEYDRNSPGAADYNRLVLEILRQGGEDVDLNDPPPAKPAKGDGAPAAGPSGDGRPSPADKPVAPAADAGRNGSPKAPPAPAAPVAPRAPVPVAVEIPLLTEAEARPVPGLRVGDGASMLRCAWEATPVPVVAVPAAEEIVLEMPDLAPEPALPRMRRDHAAGVGDLWGVALVPQGIPALPRMRCEHGAATGDLWGVALVPQGIPALPRMRREHGAAAVEWPVVEIAAAAEIAEAAKPAPVAEPAAECIPFAELDVEDLPDPVLVFEPGDAVVPARVFPLVAVESVEPGRRIAALMRRAFAEPRPVPAEPEPRRRPMHRPAPVLRELPLPVIAAMPVG
jgi:chromosome partitioning protein